MARFTSSAAWSNAEAPAILARYEPLVRRVASQMNPVQSLGHCIDREDLIAEGRVAVLEAVATYQEYGVSERSWVFRMVKRRMLDTLRRLDVRSRPEIEQATARRLLNSDDEHAARTLIFVFDDSDLRSHSWNQEDYVSASELTTAVRNSIARLGNKERDVAESLVVRGESLSQVAAKMGVTCSRVSQIYKSACDHIRRDVGASMDQMIGE